jgi:hypothetical protein
MNATEQAFAVGDVVLVQYGNGTQVARIARVMRSGYRIDRFRITRWNDKTESGAWVPSPTTQPAGKILGALPLTDKRRHVAGF